MGMQIYCCRYLCYQINHINMPGTVKYEGAITESRRMATVLLFLFQLALMLLLQAIAAMTRADTLHPHCPASCGNFSIPYPFGIGRGCYRDRSFRITCKENEEGELMPFSGGNPSTLRVFNFSVAQSQATMLKRISYVCYNASGVEAYRTPALNLSGTPFAVSATHNKFTAIGCSTVGYINGTGGTYMSGCMSFCKQLNYPISGSCTGTGCCQISLPENIVNYDSNFYERKTNDSSWKFNPCSYSFVVDQDWFQFNVSYLKAGYLDSPYPVGVPLVLDWVAGNVTCEEAKNSSSYACRSSNSTCYNPLRGLGYTLASVRTWQVATAAHALLGIRVQTLGP